MMKNSGSRRVMVQVLTDCRMYSSGNSLDNTKLINLVLCFLKMYRVLSKQRKIGIEVTMPICSHAQ